MADEQDVRNYLAYWFQAGKRVVLAKEKGTYRPSVVIQGDRYSPEFESCWSYLINEASGDCYLEGTGQTIQDLLSSKWDVTACARCEMPIPMVSLGVTPLGCPCNDLPTWPNHDIPAPRSPVSTSEQLTHIRSRLTEENGHPDNQPTEEKSNVDQNGSMNISSPHYHAGQILTFDEHEAPDLMNVRDRLIKQGNRL